MTKSKSGIVVGSYRILDKIATGGFGVTYKGEHILTGKPVCIKQCLNLLDEDEAILLDEARSIWDLRHFAIPVMRDVIRFDSKLALVMSYVPGRTLEQIVEEFFQKNNRGLDPENVVWITERVLNALWYLHDNEVIHGDIKPQNIIVQADHHAVLVDFGLSMVKPKPTDDSKGYTEYFSPPEQVKGGEPLVAASDLYSLGMTMIYALSGNMRYVQTKSVPTDTPKPLCDFIEKMIVWNKQDRPQKASELFKELKDLRIKVFGQEHSGMKPVPGFS